MAEVIGLKGARVARSATRAERIDLLVRGSRILPFDSRIAHASEIDLTGHLLLPGLINAHDHLEFSLFPRLGNGPYGNASEWARDIYHPRQSPTREHLSVPKAVRLVWGGIRNLLSGVTTVAHHNPYAPSVFTERFPIKVVRRYAWAHSLDFSPDVAELWQRAPADRPFIIHAGEGTDAHAREEIPRLREMGLLDRRTVLVHAVALAKGDIGTIRRSRCSVVWCPSSNRFLFGTTLDAEVLRSGIAIALGTDSPLTGDGDMIDEILCAMEMSGLSPDEIYPLVTSLPARALRLQDGQGRIRAGGVADLVAVRDSGQTPAAALANLRPEMVMVRGRVMLISARFAIRSGVALNGFEALQIKGRGSWMIRADIPGLYRAAADAIGPEVRLGGRRVCP